MKPSYIAVEGAIGVGKTTLARRLAASLDATLLLEQPDDNPFLPRFYRDPAASAFATQMTFLLQRAGQVEQLHQRDLFARHCVADFMFEKDRLFAELTLSPTDLSLYTRVFERLSFELPRPDRLVYLTAPLDLLMSRIARRGREYEEPIEPTYVETLAQAYARWFHDICEVPVIEIDTSRLDLVGSDADYAALLAALERDVVPRRLRLPDDALL